MTDWDAIALVAVAWYVAGITSAPLLRWGWQWLICAPDEGPALDSNVGDALYCLLCDGPCRVRPKATPRRRKKVA